ncbi:hypothetical protein BDQ12DRAFT_184421 [Crucibulum laeve]|uniref:Pentacotripeptide-repeat region of PRORP domain-containing protein n=1 Tax=Crucibulum laeve TaxID=68775 RepID=A0A5C3MGK3_9AGAR|nr:hypothetical protein BDQ12DRAFT_184421 [Crucibulum laeve]
MLHKISARNTVQRQKDILQLFAACGSFRHYSAQTWIKPSRSSQSSRQTTSRRGPPSSTPTQYRRGSFTEKSNGRDEPGVAEEGQSPLPRYLRRQALAAAATSTKSSRNTEKCPTGEKERSISQKKYRSQHYDASQEEHKSDKIKLLEPHVLSARLKKLCDAGKVDDAVAMLKNAPLDAQNTPVWNTLIWESMKAKRFQLGYQLFVDMKRRGFSPTSRTFQTMFTGLSRIEHWSSYPKQLTNARSLYDAYLRHVNAVKRIDPDSEELSGNPLSAYIKILGDAGRYQEIFDVYYAMDSEGPLAPNQFIFTAMFHALASAKETSVSIHKSAADAKLLWTQMIKASQKSPSFSVDSYLISAAITALSRGRIGEQDFAFQIVRDYFGLSAPDQSAGHGTLSLQPQSLAAILRLCNQSEKYETCVDFFQQIKRRPDSMGGLDILDRAHLEEVLKARLAMEAPGSAYHALDTLEWMLRQEITGKNGSKIRPALSTYDLVFKCCWRSVDWNSATRTFDLLTGYISHDFMDGAVAAVPRFTQRGNGRNLLPTAEGLSAMVKTAFASKNRANMRQCLRIVDHIGLERFFKQDSEEASSRALKDRAFYASKLASAVQEMVEYVLRSGDGRRAPVPEEKRRWTALGECAARHLKRSPEVEFLPAKQVENRPRERMTPLTRYEQSLRS